MRFVWVLLLCAVLAPAQSRPEETPRPRNQKKEKPQSGKHEGIQVHGHWVLEIRNPDGSLSSRREFDNSLVSDPGSGGTGFLVQLLTGYILSGGATTAVNGGAKSNGPGWAIGLNYGSYLGNSSCSRDNWNQPICYSLYLGQSNYTPQCGATSCDSNNLVVQPAGGGNQILFQGSSAPSPGNGTLDEVRTYAYSCNPGIPTCLSGNSENLWVFTVAIINVNIQAGQTVNVTVTISFM